MPSLTTLGLATNPSANPMRYPGTVVTHSCVVAGSWLYSLRHTPDQLGQWSVDVDGGPLAAYAGDGGASSLDELLMAANLVVMANRYPVLAIGSNAAPGQLRHKLSRARDVSDVVPLSCATVHGIDIGHSAHISKPGYVSYVPITRADGTRQQGTLQRRLSVLWLDQRQMQLIDATEPNYHPTVVKSQRFPLSLESGESLSHYSLYRGRWGALRGSPGGDLVDGSTQELVYGLLAGMPWFLQLVPECVDGPESAATALRADGRRRTDVREAMARERLSGDAGIPASARAPLPYRSVGQ